jgi:hypothetical protein
MRTEMNGNVNRALMRAYRRSEDADDDTVDKTFVSIPPLPTLGIVRTTGRSATSAQPSRPSAVFIPAADRWS